MGFFSAVKKIFTSASEPKQENKNEQVYTALAPEELEQFTVKLRQCEPKLSAWLQVILDGVEKADETLWARLAVLLKALETPDEEAAKFIDDFRLWTKKMDYRF